MTREDILVNDQENVFNSKKARKKLLQFLFIYCLVVTLYRLVGAEARLISLVDWFMYRKDIMAGFSFTLSRKLLVQRLPYSLMPFVGLLWLRIKPSQTGIFFVAGISGVSILNHAFALFIYLYEVLFFRRGFFSQAAQADFDFWFRSLTPRPQVIVALTLAMGLSFLSYKIFRFAWSIYTPEKATNISWTLKEITKKILYTAGIIACLAAAHELHYLWSLSFILKLPGRASFARLSALALVCVVFFATAWVGRLSRFWKWVGVLLLIGGLALLAKSPAYPSVLNAIKAFVVALICMTFAGIRRVELSIEKVQSQ
jgi:hypothetical protein